MTKQLNQSFFLILALLFPLSTSHAGEFSFSPSIQGPNGEQIYGLNLQMLAVMAAFALLPAAVLMMTSFTRIIIVLSFLRQALGTGQTPPGFVLLGLALFLTFFIMSPIFSQSYELGVQPYLEGKLTAEQAMPEAVRPFRQFMLKQTRETDIQLFSNLSNMSISENKNDLSLKVILPAFVTSELKTAFQMGFMIFIPFLIIDIVVSIILTSIGMMTISPTMISLPFKIMVFVLVDGWSLLLSTLASSFVA